MAGRGSKRYPSELRVRAGRMVAEVRGDHESEWVAMTKVAELLEVKTPETVQQWDLARWSSVRIPRTVSACDELYEIRADLVLVGSQFVEWLAGGRRLCGRKSDILQEEAFRVSMRIASFQGDADR